VRPHACVASRSSWRLEVRRRGTKPAIGGNASGAASKARGRRHRNTNPRYLHQSKKQDWVPISVN
jgi:hypothetical protein